MHDVTTMPTYQVTQNVAVYDIKLTLDANDADWQVVTILPARTVGDRDGFRTVSVDIVWRRRQKRPSQPSPGDAAA